MLFRAANLLEQQAFNMVLHLLHLTGKSKQFMFHLFATAVNIEALSFYKNCAIF